jgi:hypothetical protein
MLPYEDRNGEGFMNNDWQPEVDLYNEGVFMQNQFINANPQVCVGEPDLALAGPATARDSLFLRSISNI